MCVELLRSYQVGGGLWVESVNCLCVSNSAYLLWMCQGKIVSKTHLSSDHPFMVTASITHTAPGGPRPNTHTHIHTHSHTHTHTHTLWPLQNIILSEKTAAPRIKE